MSRTGAKKSGGSKQRSSINPNFPYGPAIGQLMDLLKRVDESGIMRIGGAGPGI